MMRGTIYYEASPASSIEGVISSNRPVVIISPRPMGNSIQVVPLTAQLDRVNDKFEHHITFENRGRTSTALCEQIRTVNVEHLGRFPIGFCPEDAMKKIDAAVAKILGLSENLGGTNDV